MPAIIPGTPSSFFGTSWSFEYRMENPSGGGQVTGGPPLFGAGFVGKIADLVFTGEDSDQDNIYLTAEYDGANEKYWSIADGGILLFDAQYRPQPLLRLVAGRRDIIYRGIELFPNNSYKHQLRLLRSSL